MHFPAFGDALYAHKVHPKATTKVAIDMSPAYQKGVREDLGNAAIAFDKYHAVAIVNDAVNNVSKTLENQSDKVFK
jgi:transposase